MIDYSELARMIQDGLQSLTNDFTFAISAQVGDFRYQPKQGKIRVKNKPIINGVMVIEPSDISPIKGFDSYEVVSSLVLTVYKEYASEIYDLLLGYVTENKGTAFELGDFACVVNFDMPTINNLGQKPGVGNSVDIQVFAYYQLISDGVISNSCIIEIDGEKMLYLSAGIGNASQLYPANIGNTEFSLSTKTLQALSLAVKIPYRNTPKTVELVRDIMAGALDKSYTLTYYDGLAFTEDEPFTVQITTQNMNISLQPQKIPAIDITATQILGDEING